MVFLRIAIGSLLRRKMRVAGIGSLVILGTILLIFGQEFSSTAAELSRRAIIDNLTGDFIIYSARSKEKPGPYSFTTPLPNIENADGIKKLLSTFDEVEGYTAYAQNISIISVEAGGKRQELPFIYYAVEPDTYMDFFRNIEITDGSFFKEGGGIVISEEQNRRYLEKYGISFSVGDTITLYGLTRGGAVNAVKTQVSGIFSALKYKNSFDYVNFMDISTYSNLYNFTGVRGESLPEELSRTLDAESEDEIFEFAESADSGKIDVSILTAEELSGFTMISVHLKDGVDLENFIDKMDEIGTSNGFKVESWIDASGGLARFSDLIRVFIYFATGLIFLIVALILMNTLIINILERTAEIGTIRAIGASRGFVSVMLLSETLILDMAAAVVGVIISLGLIVTAGRAGITLPGPFAQFLFGGGKLYLEPGLNTVLEALLAVAVISILATLYPLRIAMKVTPLKAMSEEL